MQRVQPFPTQSPVRTRGVPSKSISSSSTTESLVHWNVNFSQELDPTRVTSPHFKVFEEESLVPIESDPCLSHNASVERLETIEEAARTFGFPRSTSHLLSQAVLRKPLPSIDSPADSDTDEHVAPRYPLPTKPRAVARPKHSHHLSSVTSTLASFNFGHRVRHVSSDSSVFCLEHTMEGHRNTVTGIVRQGHLVVSASADYTLKLWDARTSGVKSRGVSKCSVLAHKGRVTALTSIQQGMVASTGANKCALWEVADSQLNKLATFDVGPATCMSAPSPLTLLMGYSGGQTRVWSLETRQQTAQFLGHSSKVNQAVSFSAGSFVSGSDDATVRLWDFRSGKCCAVLNEHRDSVTSVLSRDEYSFLSGSLDCTIKVNNRQKWDLRTCTVLSSMESHEAVFGLEMVADRVVSCGKGLTVWTGSSRTTVAPHSSTITCLHAAAGRLTTGAHDCMILVLST